MTAEALGGDIRWRNNGDEAKAVGAGLGGRSINRKNAVWWCHGAGKGGAVVDLIAFLRKCNRAAALKWVKARLASHPGTGAVEPRAHPEIDRTELAKGLHKRLRRLSPPGSRRKGCR